LSGLCAALFLTPFSHAAALRVKHDAPGPTHDGASWATAFTTVRTALDAAQAGDEVWVAGGGYSERLALPSAVALYGGFAGTEAARGQRNPSANTTSVYGSTAGPIITVDANATADTVVDGFTFQQGSRAIYASAPADLVISGNVFRDFVHKGASDEEAAGGAICLAGGRPTIAANTFRNNRTEYTYQDSWYGDWHTVPGSGGAVYVTAGDPVITANTFLNNRNAVGLLDGAARITGNTFRGNDGGLFASGAPVIKGNVFGGETSSPLRIRSTGATLVVNNAIVGTQGSLSTALYAWTEAQGTIALHNNIVAYNGGKGIWLSGPAQA
jgi:hypothetical protein